MDDTSAAIIAKLPAWYLMFVAPLIAWFVVTHIKRDKQGKWYWYSAQYEREKQLRKLDKMMAELQASEKSEGQVIKTINEQLNQNAVDKERLGAAFMDMMKKVDALADRFKGMEDKIYQHFRDDSEHHERLEKRFSLLDDKMTVISGDNDIQKLELLKQTVFLSEMPVAERIYSGLRFVKLGGNSQTKQKVAALIREFPDVWAGVRASCRDMQDVIKLIGEDING